MPKRMQSPSSINTYKQCPRRYFYQYIVNLPTKPSIHLIRGSIVHEVLEKFFSLDISTLDPEDYEYGFRSYITASFIKVWKSNSNRLSKLGMPNEQLEHYLVDSQKMLNNFVASFSEKLKAKLKETGSLEKAFRLLTPSVEEELVNNELMVKGFIDAIHEDEDILIMDYKTSNKDEITPGYRLQLAIYALLYKLKYHKTANRVGINFLKYGEKMIDVDESLLEEAKQEILMIHKLTESGSIKDYPKKESALCRWHSGGCDFYEACMKEK